MGTVAEGRGEGRQPDTEQKEKRQTVAVALQRTSKHNVEATQPGAHGEFKSQPARLGCETYGR